MSKNNGEEQNEGMWLCRWEEIYGVYPPSRAWKREDEPFVMTEDGEKICVECAKKWYEGKHKAMQENQKGVT